MQKGLSGFCFALLAGFAAAARVSINTEEGDLLGEEGFFMKPSFRLAGVPIFNAQPMPKMRRAPGAPEPKREWVVMMKSDATEGEVNSICEGSDCPQGHPAEGGLPFAEVKLSDDDLEAVLAKHPGRVSFVEADLPISIIPEIGLPEGVVGTSGGSLMDSVSNFSGGLNTNTPEGHHGDSFLESGRATPFPWGIRRIGADKTRGKGKGVHVYVLDTGIRTTHQEFGGRAIPTLETYTGVANVCMGDDPSCADDGNGHGTHCAGTVGGAAVGVADAVTLHAVKVFGADGSSSLSSCLLALDWVTTHAKMPAVASMSLGAAGTSMTYKMAVEKAVQKGIPVVVAAGNQNDDACGYSPAFASSAITVGSTTPSGDRSSFSNYGRCLNIFAPGSNIMSAGHLDNDGYKSMSGTSMATPHVAGAVARLLGDAIMDGTSPAPHDIVNDIMKELQKVGEHDVVHDVRGSPNLLLIVEPNIGTGEVLDYRDFVGRQLQAVPPMRITSQSFSGSHGFVLMHPMPQGCTQGVSDRDSYFKVKTFINKQKMSAGQALSILKRAGLGQWSAVTTKGLGLSDAFIWKGKVTGLKFTEGMQKRMGKYIISAETDQNEWVINFGKTPEIVGQAWTVDELDQVEKFMRQGWSQQYFVTEMSHVQENVFFVVMSRMSPASGFTTQVCERLSDSEIEGYIRQKEGEGFAITSVLDTFDKDPARPYFVVSTKVHGSKLFPNSGTRSIFAKGMVKA